MPSSKIFAKLFFFLEEANFSYTAPNKSKPVPCRGFIELIISYICLTFSTLTRVPFLPSPLIAIRTTSITFLNFLKDVSSSNRVIYPFKLFFIFLVTASLQVDQ